MMRSSVTDSLRRVLVSVFFLLCLWPLAVLAEPSPQLATGFQWLAASIEADGSIPTASASLATPLQGMSETVRALKLGGAVPAALLNRVTNDKGVSTEELARRLLALRAGGLTSPELVALLAGRQNPDGGFGGDDGYESNPLDTSFALSALRPAGAADIVIASAVTYLLAAQKPDGAYAHGSNPGNVALTAQVVLALQDSRAQTVVQAALDHMNSWLLHAQQADGSWGTLNDTCLVKLALAAGSSDATVQDQAAAWIVARQSADGSWQQDPYLTALALRALSARLPSAPAQSVIGLLRDTSTGAPVVGAVVSAQGASQVSSASSDQQGSFLLAPIAAGTYTLSINASGYASRTTSFEVRSGMTTDFGTISLDPVPNSGTLGGIVTSADNGTPLGGVLIKVTGAATVSAYTSADGRYQISGLAAGTVQIAASKSGYESAAGQGVVVAGANLVFSPVLRLAAVTSGLSGVVVDGASGAPLAGAAVSIGKLGLSTLSGADGRFALAGIPVGSYAVDVALAGYAPLSFTLVTDSPADVDAQAISLNKSTTPGTTATVSGVVAAKATGNPIEGASVTVSGSSQLSVLTGADGRYRITGVAPGTVNLSVTRAGFATASGSAQVLAGDTLMFSPKLDAALTPSVSGRIVDIVSLAGVAGAKATLDVNVTAAGADGSFSFQSIPFGNHTLTLEAPGYLTRKLPVFSDGVNPVDLKSITLALTSTPVKLSGTVTDAATKQPVAKASVTLLGTNFSALTDTQGHYTIEGIPQGDVTVRYSASGYLSDTVILAMSPYQVAPVDRALNAGQASGLDLAVSTDRATYGAYEPVTVEANVNNTGTSDVVGIISLVLMDKDGKYVTSMPVTRLDENGQSQQLFTFAPGTTTARVQWPTDAAAPGRYTASVRIRKREDATVDSPMIELAQREAQFDIAPTSRIESVRITPLPAYANVDAIEQLGYRIDVVNRSNVAVSSKLTYQTRDPKSALIDTGAIALDLVPAEPTWSLVVQGAQYTFMAAGEHQVSLQVVDGAQPASLVSGAIVVAPGTRVETHILVTPAVIVPNADKRIHVDLSLKGVEQK